MRNSTSQKINFGILIISFILVLLICFVIYQTIPNNKLITPENIPQPSQDNINKAYFQMWNDYRKPNGSLRNMNILDKQDLALLNRETQNYDIITVSAARANQLTQSNNLFTQEAFKTYFLHWADQGIVILNGLTAKNSETNPSILRIIRTALSAMEETGIQNPENHIVVYNYSPSPNKDKYARHLKNPLRIEVAIHCQPLDESVINFYKTWAGTLNFLGKTDIEPRDLLFFSYLPSERLNTELESFIRNRELNSNTTN